MESPPYEQVVYPDPLPSYSTSISKTGRLLCKQEFISPQTTALNRHWNRVEAELRGTTLLLAGASKCIRSYTLQAADVGLANDYKNRTDVFRARLEGEQLLFIAPGIEAAVEWVEALLAAIVISEPLENRRMPKYPKLPPRRTKRASKVKQDVMDGFRRRLWSEVAWHTRQRREWLLEVPSRTHKERWREVVHGRRSSSSEAASEFCLPLNERRSSASSRCQCPCSSCWTSPVPNDDLADEVQGQAAAEEESYALSKDTEMVGADSDLEHIIRCTRRLGKLVEWKVDYYIRDGRKVKIPPRSVLTQSQISTWPMQRA